MGLSNVTIFINVREIKINLNKIVNRINKETKML